MQQIELLQYISPSKCNQTSLDKIKMALQGGCKWVQLRLKNCSTADYIAIGKKAKALCAKYQAKLIINDNIQVAKAVEADGIHLGKNDAPAEQARAILGSSAIVGCTANNWKDIQILHRQPIQYIGLGPFRFTTTKVNLSPVLGLEGYQKMIEKTAKLEQPLPIIAIGGIQLEDLDTLWATGISGVAVSGSINQQENPTTVVRKFLTTLELLSQESY